MSVFNTEDIKLQTGPLQNLFTDIKKIIQSMEVKNKALADTYETEESRGYGELWIVATEKQIRISHIRTGGQRICFLK